MVLFLLVRCGNRPPSDPVLLGPDSGQPGETLLFRSWSVDPDGDDIAYRFDWGDTDSGNWTPFAASGDTFLRRHIYDRSDSYEVTVQARDRHELESGFSTAHLVRVEPAGPYPLGPPVGPELLYPDTAGAFTAAADHIRGDSIGIQFDWDGTPGPWSKWDAPGTPIQDTHRFRSVGTYRVRFRARDRAGNTSLWSEPLACTVQAWPLAPPHRLRLNSLDGLTLILRWDTGRNPDAVRYGVWFRFLNQPDFKLLQLVAGDSAFHDPEGMTGCYTVSALLDERERFAAETLTTRPVYTDTLLLHELNLEGHSGYGWDEAGHARILKMSDPASAEKADLYFTDRSPGSTGPVFFLSSPHLGPDDPGGTIPEGPWRRTGLGMLGSRPWEPLPPRDSPFYTNLVDVTLLETWIAMACASGSYALVNSLDPEPAFGRVRLRSWYQTVPGLRLLLPETPPHRPQTHAPEPASAPTGRGHSRYRRPDGSSTR